MRGAFRAMIVVNAAALAFVALWFFLIPAGTIARDATDGALEKPGVGRAAWKLFRELTPRYERWARRHVASGRGANTPVTDISGSEWPVFGSAFYVWSVESLQEAWEKDPSRFPVAPKEFARAAVEAAKDLILDPASAGWVRKYWGDDYLTREDCFYRMLIIGSLTAHYRLTGETKHLATLRSQTEALAAEIDNSTTGLIDDYPGQCYNTDVVAAVATIRRADAVLGTDHSAFAKRALRGFQGRNLDTLALVPFQADSRTGRTLVRARGSSNSYLCIFAPEVWPEASAEWYAIYEKHFWQHRWTADGFRELPAEVPGYDWWLDVDAGPVLAGHGISADAFGLAAARVNGRFDHAKPLAAEAIAVSWPLPDGTLALPRLLSNATEAPLVGEAGILFALTRQPLSGFAARTGGSVPTLVWIIVGMLTLVGLYVAWLAFRTWRLLRRLKLGLPRAAKTQWVAWIMSAALGLVTAFAIFAPAGAALLIVPLGMPFGLPKPPKARKCGSGIPA